MEAKGGTPGGAGSAGAVTTYYVAVGTADAKLSTLAELLLALQLDGRRPLAICCNSRDSLDAVVCCLLQCQAFVVYALHSDMAEREREAQLVAFRQVARQQRGGGTAADGAVPDPLPLDGPSTAAPSAPGAASQPTAAPPASPSASPSQQPVSGATAAAPAGPEPPSPATSSFSPSSSAASAVLVATDVCLRAAHKELLPLGLPLLVQYDLPTRKDVYTRRVACAFGGGKERRSGRQRPIVIDFVVAGQVAQFRAVERFGPGVIQEMPVHVADIFVGP